MPVLETARLSVTPFTPALVEAALRGRTHLGWALGVRVPDDWLQDEGEGEEILPVIAEMLRADMAHRASEHWGWWLILHRAERTLIGEVTCREPRDGTGAVEIGYGVVPAYQRQGHATEAAGAVVDWALRQPGVARVVACCLRDNAASRRVLEKLSLRQVGIDGELLVWERRRRGVDRASRVTSPKPRHG